MSNIARATIRFLLGFCLWWLFVSPVFFGTFSTPFLMASATALMAWILGLIFQKWSNRLDFVFFAAILVMAIFNQNRWILPPILMGCVYLFLCITLCFLRTKSTTPHTHPLPEPPHKLPILFYLLGFFGTWAVGLLVTALIPSVHAPIILMFWTCLMFILFNEVSALSSNALWVGYKTRRECFVSKRRWQFRFMIAVLLIVLWMGCSLWFWME